jgi:KipI family sensor histidine kinase inhibitor
VTALRIEPFGDRALLVTLGDSIDLDTNAEVHGLASTLLARRVDGIGVPVPAYASLLVPFDLERVDGDRVSQLVADALARREGTPAEAPLDAGREVEVPCHYGGDDGPDLAEVAARLGRSETDVVTLHSGTTYHVYMLGFSPGFGYLGTLPEELALPRRAEPRVRVPAGSVAIAERQTAVYPSVSAGGWHLIGRTELSMWDPRRDPPALLAAGQRVRFVPA